MMAEINSLAWAEAVKTLFDGKPHWIWLADHPAEAERFRALLADYLAHLPAEQDSLVERLRAEGWSVAVHNDYKLAGARHTFWLFTHPDGRWIKGEGRTDAAALALCAADALSRPKAETGRDVAMRRALEALSSAARAVLRPLHPGASLKPAGASLTNRLDSITSEVEASLQRWASEVAASPHQPDTGMVMSDQTRIVLIDREDGGLSVRSPDLPGLILSGRDPAKVAASIPVAIKALRSHAAAPPIEPERMPLPERMAQ